MARVTTKAVLPVSARRLWPLVRWDGRLLDWYPDALTLRVEGTVKGALRHIGLRDGSTLIQRLDHVSGIEDAYTYTVVGGDYPVADYLAQIRVLDHDDAQAILVWTANFEPRDASEEAAEAFIRRLYQSGFDALLTLLHAAENAATSTSRATL